MALAALANFATGSYVGGVLTCLLALDISGTAQILFVVTKQFETAVLTTGRDITVLLVVRIPELQRGRCCTTACTAASRGLQRRIVCTEGHRKHANVCRVHAVVIKRPDIDYD